ncbi:MAG: uracil-DNA glycosylase [Nannocystis sp.]|nr:uracil-DNA glycosylase [Nannocystis sp.]
MSEQDVTDPREEARRIAGAFAAHLRHLQEFRGVRYVSAAPMPPGSPSAAAAEYEPLDQSGAPLDEPSVQREQTASSPLEASSPAPAPDVRSQAKSWSAAQKLEYLRAKNLGDCQRCPLAATRTKIVFGVGDADAPLMFVGEAPGHDEDLRGEPFVGRAGQRLNQWIEALGLTRSAVYIANVVKCRPPLNRDPEPLEVERCSPFLRAQIRAIRPQVLVALGRHAGMLLIGAERRSMGSMRQQVWTYEEPQAGLRVPVVVTYHPSYVLRQERDEAEGEGTTNATVLADLRRALALVTR